MIKFLKSFRKEDDGVTAIEFGIFAVPFLLLIMGILEIGIMFGAATVLNGATEDAARQIRTGQAQTSGDAEGTFRTLLCGNLYALIDCNTLNYHVVKLDDDEDFQSAIVNPDIMPPVYDLEEPTSFTTTGFDAGEQNDRVIIRVSYEYPLYTPLAGPFFSNTPEGNRHLLISTVIIQNEPY